MINVVLCVINYVIERHLHLWRETVYQQLWIKVVKVRLADSTLVNRYRAAQNHVVWVRDPGQA